MKREKESLKGISLACNTNGRGKTLKERKRVKYNTDKRREEVESIERPRGSERRQKERNRKKEKQTVKERRKEGREKTQKRKRTKERERKKERKTKGKEKKQEKESLILTVKPEQKKREEKKDAPHRTFVSPLFFLFFSSFWLPLIALHLTLLARSLVLFEDNKSGDSHLLSLFLFLFFFFSLSISFISFFHFFLLLSLLFSFSFSLLLFSCIESSSPAYFILALQRVCC